MIVRRDGDRDLHFDGVPIGDGLWGADPNDGPGVRVRIFRLEKGDIASGLARYVVAVHTRHGDNERFHADVCVGSKAVLQSLLEDGSGRLGVASKQAWEGACVADLELGDERYERI